jgi:hypothetical protein
MGRAGGASTVSFSILGSPEQPANTIAPTAKTAADQRLSFTIDFLHQDLISSKHFPPSY